MYNGSALFSNGLGRYFMRLVLRNNEYPYNQIGPGGSTRQFIIDSSTYNEEPFVQ